MAKQDDFIRLTLRLPPNLYEDVRKTAGPQSMNAEIVRRLESSVDVGVLPPTLRERLAEDAEENGRSLNSEIIHRLVSTVAVDLRNDKELAPFVLQSAAARAEAREAFLAGFIRGSGQVGETVGQWAQQHPEAAEAFATFFFSGHAHDIGHSEAKATTRKGKR